MKSELELEIRLSNLKDGNHRFEFDLAPSFFEKINSPALKSGSLHLAVDMIKSDSMIQLNLDFKGQLADLVLLKLLPRVLQLKPSLVSEQKMRKWSQSIYKIFDRSVPWQKYHQVS